MVYEGQDVGRGDPVDDITLDRIVDVDAIRDLVEDFHDLTGHVMSLVDLDDRFLARVGWHDACISYHRANPESCELCRQSDVDMVGDIGRGEVRAYRCKNGLWHVFTPLVIGERRVGNIFTSQFFFDDEDVDLEWFAKRADRFGWDREAYLAAIAALPRYSHATVDALMRFYARLAEQIAMLGLTNLQLAETMAARERALEARVRSEAFLSTMFTNMPMPLAVVDEAGTIEYLNDEFTRVLGYTADDVHTIEEMHLKVHPDATYRAVASARWGESVTAALQRDGRIEPHEYQFVCKNGDTRDVVISGALVDGKRLVLINDITERKRTEEALRHSEAKFAIAYRTSPDAVNVNRLSDGMYLDINEGFTTLTGFTAEDVKGRTSAEIDIWADPADRRRLVKSLTANGLVTNLEAQFRRKDGTLTTALMSARILEMDGETCILSVTRDISLRKQAEAEVHASKAAMERMVLDVAETMGRVVEARDPYTQGHQQRVATLAKNIALRMGLPREVIDEVEMAGLLHDVGKLRIPTEILTKPGILSDIEFALVKDHPAQGCEILQAIDFPWAVADVAMQHHERMDGSGYPAGLAGDEILLAARIMAVADVVEAMASHRPYRPALGVDAAIEEIVAHPGLYDPAVVEACVSLHREGKLGL